MATIDPELLEYLASLRESPMAWLAELAEQRLKALDETPRETAGQRIEAAHIQLQEFRRAVLEPIKFEREATAELIELAPNLGLKSVILEGATGLPADLMSPHRLEAIDRFIAVIDEELRKSERIVRQREGEAE